MVDGTRESAQKIERETPVYYILAMASEPTGARYRRPLGG
jgi:hypothetical protein